MRDSCIGRISLHFFTLKKKHISRGIALSLNSSHKLTLDAQYINSPLLFLSRNKQWPSSRPKPNEVQFVRKMLVRYCYIKPDAMLVQKQLPLSQETRDVSSALRWALCAPDGSWCARSVHMAVWYSPLYDIHKAFHSDQVTAKLMARHSHSHRLPT